MPAILRERHLLNPISAPVALRREEALGTLEWFRPLSKMFTTVAVDQSPTQRIALIVLAISTPLLALLILLFFLTFRRHNKQREARERGFNIGNPQLIPEPAKTYIPEPPMGSDMVGALPVMGMVNERPVITMPEPQIYRPGGTPIGNLPSLEVTPPSLPNSNAASPHTPRTLPGFRTPRSPRSPRSARGHYGPPPPTPFGEVADQPLSANSLERMINRMESDMTSPAPTRF